MNVEKHECSLLKVVSDVGSTPTASTISELSCVKPDERPDPSVRSFYLAESACGCRFPDLRLLLLLPDGFVLGAQPCADE